MLVATLRRGDIDIMDGLLLHKSDPTLALIIQDRAQVLFLPDYSSVFKPIEMMWSEVEDLLRSAQAVDGAT